MNKIIIFPRGREAIKLLIPLSKAVANYKEIVEGYKSIIVEMTKRHNIKLNKEDWIKPFLSTVYEKEKETEKILTPQPDLDEFLEEIKHL